MSPSDAYREAHHHILSCAEMLRLLTMALDGSADAIGPEERETLSNGMQRALDEARAARTCFADIRARETRFDGRGRRNP